MSQIIKFPDRLSEVQKEREEEELSHYEAIAKECLAEIIEVLLKYQYNPIESGMKRDLGVILNLISSALFRYEEKEHFLHTELDDLYQLIQYVMFISEQPFTNDE